MNPYTPPQSEAIVPVGRYFWLATAPIFFATAFVAYIWIHYGSYRLALPVAGQTIGNYLWNFASVVLPFPVLICLLPFFTSAMRRRPVITFLLSVCLLPSGFYFAEVVYRRIPGIRIGWPLTPGVLNVLSSTAYAVCCFYVVFCAVHRMFGKGTS